MPARGLGYDARPDAARGARPRPRRERRSLPDRRRGEPASLRVLRRDADDGRRPLRDARGPGSRSRSSSRARWRSSWRSHRAADEEDRAWPSSSRLPSRTCCGGCCARPSASRRSSTCRRGASGAGLRDLDLSVVVHGRRVANPVGPAAGPHGQMAQNVLLSWLAGGRFLELKTVQANDRLTIPRPCIDMETVGYNVEWSQELRLAESLREYVKGSMLVDVARARGAARPARRPAPRRARPRPERGLRPRRDPLAGGALLDRSR